MPVLAIFFAKLSSSKNFKNYHCTIYQEKIGNKHLNMRQKFSSGFRLKSMIKQEGTQKFDVRYPFILLDFTQKERFYMFIVQIVWVMSIEIGPSRLLLSFFFVIYTLKNPTNHYREQHVLIFL